MSSGMIIDGIAASEAIDSSGEILDIKGCDISDLEQGLGVLNWEHRGDDAAGASANDIIGKIVFCKKIYGAEDCTDSRQLEYWQKIQLPYIYIIARLFDGSGHPGAIAAAAMIRDYQANKEPLLIRYSIEGTTLKKDKSSNRLLESVARRVAATIKPCNKSCHSGLIADPNGIVTDETRKNENPHPNFTPLGGSFEYEAGVVDSEKMEKALAAGSYNAAPGALVGGSALQVEDRGLRNRVKAAVRDWDRKTPFKKFLKHKLPEASDEFVDRFSDLVQDYTIKKAQKEVAKKVVGKAVAKEISTKIQAKQTAQAKPKQIELMAPDERLTIRGIPVNANPEGTKTTFDERKGVLHTAKGSFPMYIPSRDKQHPGAGQTFANIMQDPKVTKFHDYAMANWSKLHQHLKAGTLPPEVIMHGVLFSQLSPNTPVPMQELMYAHLVDSMKATGKDPRSAEGLDVLRHDWMNRDHPQKWPSHSREHFERLESQLRMRNDSKGTGRVKGDIGSFMLANNKFKNMSQYHTLHDNLVELIGRHKHDARSGVEEMMFHKKQSKLWDAKRRRDIDKGKGDPGEYTAGPDIPGLAPKTARYTYGMLGGGNVMVPDTHFARYLFGLDRKKDTPTIDHIKAQLWSTDNTHVLNAIDRYYAKHHDAVKHMQAHPVWGKHFEKPEDAVFPAFWKNWVGILPHEASRGMTNFGWNEATDHKPFWDAIGPYMRKSEGVNTNLAMRTAKMHHEWVEKYGEMPAMLMYFHYLVPQLLAASEKQATAQQITKFEALSIELRKGVLTDLGQTSHSRLTNVDPAPKGGQHHDGFTDLQGETPPPVQKPDPDQEWRAPPFDSKGPITKPSAGGTQPIAGDQAQKAQQPPPETVKFNDKVVKPGMATSGDKRFYLLDHSPEHYTAVPEEKIYGWEPSDLVRLNRKGERNYRVVADPEHLAGPTIVSHEVHALPEYTHHPETQDLVHGLDMGQPKEMGPADNRGGINRAHSFWAKNAKGQRVYVKGEEPSGGAETHQNESNFSDANREALYHNLAKDFYGLGQYVTPTAAITHPQTGRKYTVVQHSPGEHMDHYGPDKPKHQQILKALGDRGELDKLAIMNMINHNTDRHGMNYFIHPDTGIKLFDHGRTFGDRPYAPMRPDYLDSTGEGWGKPKNIHPEAVKWALGLSAPDLGLQMRRHGVPEGIINESVRRLKAVQNHLQKPATIGEALQAPFRMR